MRKFGVLLAVLIFSSAAFAVPIPAYVGFTFTIVDPNPTGCMTTWILPNNVPPDFYYGGSSPGYNNVSAANSCFPGSGFVFGNIIFPGGGGGGIAFNNFAGGDWFGPVLFSQTASGISFHIGTFGLSDEFDLVHAVIDIHPAPEPATLLLVIGGFAAMLCSRRIRKAEKKTH